MAAARIEFERYGDIMPSGRQPFVPVLGLTGAGNTF
jgi:hypothetical protein